MYDNIQETAEELQKIVKNRGVSADIIAISEKELSVSHCNGKFEGITQSNEIELGLRVFYGKRNALVSSNDTRDLEQLADQAIQMAKLASDDPFSRLADEAEYLNTSQDELHIYDKSMLNEIS